jgi:hypothetical protein
LPYRPFTKARSPSRPDFGMDWIFMLFQAPIF